MPSTLQFTNIRRYQIPAASTDVRASTRNACRRGRIPRARRCARRIGRMGYVSETKILAPRSAVQMKNGVKPSSVRMPLSRRRPVSRCCCLPRCRCRCSDARTQIPKGDGAMCLVFLHSRAVRICTVNPTCRHVLVLNHPAYFWGVGPSPKITADCRFACPAPARP